MFLNSYSERRGFCRCVSRSHLVLVFFREHSVQAVPSAHQLEAAEGTLRHPACQLLVLGGGSSVSPTRAAYPGFLSALAFLCGPPAASDNPGPRRAGPVWANTRSHLATEVKSGFSCCKGTPASTCAPQPFLVSGLEGEAWASG